MSRRSNDDGEACLMILGQIALYFVICCVVAAVQWLYKTVIDLPVIYHVFSAAGLAILIPFVISGIRRHNHTRAEMERHRQAELAEAHKQELEAMAEARARDARLAAAEKERKMRDFALTCFRCRKLAKPIPGTGKPYRCEHCGNQFISGYHNVKPD
jgi:hypothetical protein